MSNQKIRFNVMVMDLNILEKVVKIYNEDPYTYVDFKIVSEIDDELAFATIEVSKNNIDDVFRLGYRLAVFENDLRDKGEFDF